MKKSQFRLETHRVKVGLGRQEICNCGISGNEKSNEYDRHGSSAT